MISVESLKVEFGVKPLFSGVSFVINERDRVGAAHVADKFTADQKKFIDEVRRERACELAFEGFRWNDLQRWLLLTEYPYNIKTSQEFRRVGNFDYSKNDPRDAEVTGWSEKVIVERQECASIRRLVLSRTICNRQFSYHS